MIYSSGCAAHISCSKASLALASQHHRALYIEAAFGLPEVQNDRFDDTWGDEFIYALLKAEWEDRQGL